MRSRSVLSALLLLVVVVVALPVRSATAESASPEAMTAEARLAVAPGPDGSLALHVDGASDGTPLVVAADDVARLGWDTTAIISEEVRSDLVRLEIVGFDGPGIVRATAPTRHGDRVVVLDSTTDAATVLQVGRTGELAWTVDAPGRHTVEIEASIPKAPSGMATGRATLVLDGSAGRSAGGDRSTPATSAPPTSEVPLAAAAVDAPPAELPTPAAPLAAAAARDQVVVSDGHVDMGPRIVDGAWRIQIRDDSTSPATWRELSDVVLAVADAALIDVPDQEAFAFLGPPGTPYHLLPQAQVSGLVWPGWNTQDPSVVDAVPGSVTWTVRGVDGPGRFAVFATTAFGGTQVHFDSAQGFPQSMQVPRNVHAHANWAFGAPGLYRIQVEMAATLGSGDAVSDTRTLVFAVGSGTDPNGGFGAPGGPGGPVDGPGTADGGSGSGRTGSGSGAAAGSTSGTGSLVKTGADIAPLLAIGSGLIGLGALVDLTVRRRRAAANP